MFSASQTPGSSSLKSSRRIYFMDEIRGFDLILMVFFHAFYVIGYIFNFWWGEALFRFFSPVEPFFAGLFIFICGISCRLSHSNWKRGCLLLLVSLGLSLFLYLFMPDEMIWFGILHFLSVSILLFALCRPLLNKIPPFAGILACALFFLLTWWIPPYHGSLLGIKGLISLSIPSSWVANPLLYPLGLGKGSGADYFPLLPWFFCFLAGSFTGVWAKQNRFPAFMYKSRLPWLAWLGRHTLVIYVIHQPVVYGLCLLIVTIFQL